jgi:pyrroloquinoline quinone (PQQ) biosynthesis protein C
MKEEAGHEEWVLNDLDAMGVDRPYAISSPPTFLVSALIGYNYWTADRRHPCAVLGMVYALEVIASVYGGPITSAIRDSLLLETDRGISFISSHATLDAEHMAELRIVMNRIEDDDAKNSIVEATAFNFHQFTRILEAI